MPVLLRHFALFLLEITEHEQLLDSASHRRMKGTGKNPDDYKKGHFAQSCYLRYLPIMRRWCESIRVHLFVGSATHC